MRGMIAFSAAVMLALAACGEGMDGEAAPSPDEATSSPTPELPQRLEGVFDLRAAVEEAGYKCSEWEVVPETTNAIERAHCTDEVVLSIHTNATQAQASIEDTAEIVNDMLGGESVHLTGPNWSINCGTHLDLCEQFAVVLGGEVQVISPDE